MKQQSQGSFHRPRHAYRDITDICQIQGHAKWNPVTCVATLTENKPFQAGAFVGTTCLNVQYDFTLQADIYLGANRNGANGIGIAFHKGKMGFMWEGTSGLGILHAKDGVGFEVHTLGTTTNEERADSFAHGRLGSLGKAHAGFVATDRMPYLQAVTTMREIMKPKPHLWRTLTIQWQIKTKTLTAILETQTSPLLVPRTQIWTYQPDWDDTEKYTFLIAASTSTGSNQHQIGIIRFDAHFTKPMLTANDVQIQEGTEFDPLQYPPIELKAVDEKQGDMRDQVYVTENTVNSSKPGTYTVTYTVTNQDQEQSIKTIDVMVYGSPTIHAKDIQVAVGTEFDPFDYPSLSLQATDALDGDISDQMMISDSNVNIDKPGIYQILYYVKNSFGVATEKAITVDVYGLPVIYANAIQVEVGMEFDPLSHVSLALRAEDERDGDITHLVEVQKYTVDTTKPGEYEVVYQVTNRYGAVAHKKIRVTVLLMHEYWEGEGTSEWKYLSGKPIPIVKQAQHSLEGEHVFYTSRPTTIVKPVSLDNMRTYQLIICIKPEETLAPRAPILKAKYVLYPERDSKGIPIVQASLLEGEEIQNGYYQFKSPLFRPMELGLHTNPYIHIELLVAGWIGSIQLCIKPMKGLQH